MVRGIQIEAVDHLQLPVIAVGNDYADGYVIESHKHRRDQLLYGSTGVLEVSTPQGTWIVPPNRGVRIPAGVIHRIRMLGAVRMQSLYLSPEEDEGRPTQCEVVGISAFMRSLLAEALDVPLAYPLQSRAGALMSLIQFEIKQLPVLPLALPYPEHPALAQLCRRFIQRPLIHQTIDDWCTELGMSRRVFTRLFRRETGLSFVAWRSQACLVAALPRMVAGESVTAVALELGYDNPASFTTMFKRLLGASPRAYLTQNAD